MESDGTSLNAQTGHDYRHRASGIKERMGSTEERPYKTASRTQSFSWHFPIEYTAIYQEDSTFGKQIHSHFSGVTHPWL